VESNTVITPGYSGSNGGQNGWPRDNASRTEIVEKTQEAVAHLAEQVRGQVKSQLDQQKERVAESVEGVAEALHAMSRQLREQEQTAIADWADSIGESASRVFNYLAEKDVDQLAGEVEQFARRQQALFLTGAFALGLMASRFFKSSGSQNGYSYPSASREYGTADLRYPAASSRGVRTDSTANWAPANPAPSSAPAAMERMSTPVVTNSVPTPVATTSIPAAVHTPIAPTPVTTSTGETETVDTAVRTPRK